MGKKHVPLARVDAVVLVDPKNYREAMRDPRVEKWKEAMRTEIEALEHNDTWEVIVKPRNAKLLHSKWVYKLKIYADGRVERYRARLVARGDEQVYGVDYTFTFSAVLDLVSGKVILAVSRVWGVPARHGDVPSAYDKADKEADLEILLHIPQGMEIDDELLRALGAKDKRELALRLKKGLYGLKQSGRLWNLLLHKILLSVGFCQCYTDSCLYIKHEADDKTLVGIYVDDVLVTGTSVQKVDGFFNDMKVVELKDLGVVTKFLGIVFDYDVEAGWTLSQEAVIDEMLDKFGLAKASPPSVSCTDGRAARNTPSAAIQADVEPRIQDNLPEVGQGSGDGGAEGEDGPVTSKTRKKRVSYSMKEACLVMAEDITLDGLRKHIEKLEKASIPKDNMIAAIRNLSLLLVTSGPIFAFHDCDLSNPLTR
ncbi:putative Pol Polyprotein [Phytophthora palmivora]|uniref:Pol Polyprotein n=1 Tax=Phytophthora palmivora TaxID=4796 RepID=A0A2P4X8M5_9STRA|nr:putative Pol Polyprotein [Phytophthora palmivora]